MPHEQVNGSLAGGPGQTATVTMFTVPEGRKFYLSFLSVVPASGNAITGNSWVQVQIDGSPMFFLNADKETIEEQFANPLEVDTDIVLALAPGETDTFNWSLAGDWE